MEELRYIFEDGEEGIAEIVGDGVDEFDFLYEDMDDELEDELFLTEIEDEWDCEDGEWELS